MANIIVFGVSGISKLTEIKEDDYIHLIISKDEQLAGDTLIPFLGKSFEVTIVESNDNLRLGFEGGKIAAKYADAEVLFPDESKKISNSKIASDKTDKNAEESAPKKKRRRRTKAEIERDRELAAQNETGKKKKRHRRTKAEIEKDRKKEERAKKAKARREARKADEPQKKEAEIGDENANPTVIKEVKNESHIEANVPSDPAISYVELKAEENASPKEMQQYSTETSIGIDYTAQNGL